MNHQYYNGNTITTLDSKVIINGKEYPYIKGMSGNLTTTINGKIYIDGFELINGKWKRTIKALWYLLF